MAKQWFVRVKLSPNQEFLRAVPDAATAQTTAEEIFTKGFATQVMGIGVDRRFRLHPLKNVEEVQVFFEDTP